MQARSCYGVGGEIHLTASGSAGTVVYSAGEVLAPAAVDGNVCAVVGGSSPIRGGEKFAAYTKGVFALKKAAETEFAKGAPVEWDDSGNLAKASGTFGVGGAVLAAGAGATEVLVNINEFGQEGT